MATTKTPNAPDSIAPPPSYEMYTMDSSATESHSRPNGYSLFLTSETVSTPDTSYARSQTLRRKLKYSLALNIFLLLITLPLAFVGFALVYASNNANSNNLNTASNDASANILPVNDSFAILNPRGDAIVPRRCITGFTIAELIEGLKNIQKNHDDKGRIWMTPCNQVADVEYTNQGVEAE